MATQAEIEQNLRENLCDHRWRFLRTDTLSGDAVFYCERCLAYRQQAG